FILVKYCEYKELTNFIYSNIFKPFQDYNDFDYEIIIDNDTKLYILETFKNLTEHYKRTEVKFRETVITNSYSNIIIVMSLINWNEDDFKEIIESFSTSLINVRSTNNEFDAMGKFLNYNYFIHRNIYRSVTLVLDIYLERLIQYSSYDMYQLDTIQNIFDSYMNYMHDCNLKYSNSELIRKLISKLKFNNGKVQRRVCSKILVKFYNISDDRLRTIISSYIESLRKSKWSNNDYEEIVNEIILNTHEFNVKKEFIDFLSGWIDNYLNLTVINTSEFKSHINFLGLKKQIGYLCKEIKHKEYEVIDKKILSKRDLLNIKE
uniref:hypothetical protein n=1 Tax=Psychrobacter immobilis TaxID=498 RepID=UPI001917C03C